MIQNSHAALHKQHVIMSDLTNYYYITRAFKKISFLQHTIALNNASSLTPSAHSVYACVLTCPSPRPLSHSPWSALSLPLSPHPHSQPTTNQWARWEWKQLMDEQRGCSIVSLCHLLNPQNNSFDAWTVVWICVRPRSQIPRVVHPEWEAVSTPLTHRHAHWLQQRMIEARRRNRLMLEWVLMHQSYSLVRFHVSWMKRIFGRYLKSSDRFWTSWFYATRLLVFTRVSRRM